MKLSLNNNLTLSENREILKSWKTYEWNRGRSLGSFHADGQLTWPSRLEVSKLLSLPAHPQKFWTSSSQKESFDGGWCLLQQQHRPRSPILLLAASKPMANISRLLPAALLLRVHGPATTIRVHTHGQGRPRSPIRQRQCNSNCLQKHAASAAPTAATCFVRDPGATTTTVVVVRHML